MRLAYDVDNLQVFSGKDCFNRVYCHPSAANPTGAILLEAKAGHSSQGDRDDGTGTGKRVQQGRAATGAALQTLANFSPARIAYIGVHTAYDQTHLQVHDPVGIFYKEV